jgi:hypothetical protein
MSIPNKIILNQGSVLTNTTLNTLQDNFEDWIKNHYHTNEKIPILTIASEDRVLELIGNDDFLFGFTNRISNSTLSITDYAPTYLVLKLNKLSELYNRSVLLGKEDISLKNLIYSYSSSYNQDSTTDTFYYIFKTPTFEEDGLDIIVTIPALTSNGLFTYEGSQYYQKSQKINIKKSIIKDYSYVETTYTVLTLELDILTNTYIGIPALPIIASSILDDNNNSAASHVADTSKHAASFATERGLMEVAKENIFATPNWQKDFPLYTDGKFMISSNDKTLSLNIIKNETNTNRSTIARSNDSPLDGMFRGNSQSLNWMNANYFTTEERKDVKVMQNEVMNDYNYEISANESGANSQRFTKSELIPTANVGGKASTFYNQSSGEDRATRVIKDVQIGVTEGTSFVTLPILLKLSPNKHSKSYMYTFYYGKLSKELQESFLGKYAGAGLYQAHRTSFEYNVSPGLYFEKIITLGSPYEPFNLGAEHIYTKTVVKDFSNPEASFNGWVLEEQDIAEIKQYETRMI